MSLLYKKILIPLDGSELAAKALPHAEEIATATDAKLTLFQVVVDPMKFAVVPSGVSASGTSIGLSGGAVGALPAIQDDAAHRAAMDEAQRDMEELATSLKHRKIDAEAVIDTGDPAELILDYAKANDIDLIVMSTHGRTGMARWAYGSVANKVLQAAPCSVLVVRPEIT